MHKINQVCSVLGILMPIGFYAFVFSRRDHLAPDVFYAVLRNGVPLIGFGIAGVLYLLFGKHIEAWKQRQRDKISGSVWAFDLKRLFRKK